MPVALFLYLIFAPGVRAMPILTYDSQDAVPEGLREGAKKNDTTGRFEVNVVLGNKLDEFRNTNIAVAKERDTLLAYVNSVKPHVGEDATAFVERLKSLTTLEQQVKDGKLQTTTDIEAEVLKRVDSMKGRFEETNKTLAGEKTAAERRAAEAEERYNRSIVRQGVTSAVVDPASGANPQALDDILERANRVFQVKDGKLVAMNGESVIYGADGASPKTPTEWLADLRRVAPYLFKGSNGGGSGGNGSGNEGRGGLSETEFSRLSPMKKLEMANMRKK